MLNAIEIKWDVIGAKLAALSDEEQFKFFTGFARELEGYDTHYQREMQMLSIRDKLDSKARLTLEKYFPALWYDNKQEAKGEI